MLNHCLYANVLNGQSPTFEQNGFEPPTNVQRESYIRKWGIRRCGVFP